MAIRIVATGSYTPEKILTNADLEKMVDTNDQWILERTGISERHIAPKEMSTGDMALKAAEKALAQANLKGEDLDLIVIGTITPDHSFPSTACILQSKLGAKNAAAMDIEAACSGYIYGLEVASSLMKASPSRYKLALVIGAEKLSSITDWSDRGTCILFGDGAGCAILKHDDTQNENTIQASWIGADGHYGHLLQMPAGGSRNPTSLETVQNGDHFIKMCGPEIFKLAVTAMTKACTKVLETSGVTPNQLRWLVPHQANMRILTAVASRIGIDPEHNVYINVNRMGNTSAASIAICLDEMNSKGLIKHGDYVLLTAFGGGLTFGAMLLRW